MCDDAVNVPIAEAIVCAISKTKILLRLKIKVLMMRLIMEKQNGNQEKKSRKLATLALREDKKGM